MKSIHGKELFNLASIFTTRGDDCYNSKEYAQHLKEMAENHFGVNPECFEGVSDKQVVKALRDVDRAREDSQFNAQFGGLATTVCLAASFTSGVGIPFAMAGLYMLNKARLEEKIAHVHMKRGLETMKNSGLS